MMRFFTADTHFGHNAIVKMMGRVAPTGALMASMEEHDMLLINTINKYVGKQDELFVIGDFAWDRPGFYRDKIQCRKINLVLGNHDKKQKSSNVFGQTPEVMRTKAYNLSRKDYVKLYLCHYPTAYWDGSHRGWAHLYGHTHGQREEYLDLLEPQRRSMDIGVDNIFRLYGEYRPLSEWEVYDYMAKRSGHDDIRFYHDYQQGLYIERGLYNQR